MSSSTRDPFNNRTGQHHDDLAIIRDHVGRKGPGPQYSALLPFEKESLRHLAHNRRPKGHFLRHEYFWTKFGPDTTHRLMQLARASPYSPDPRTTGRHKYPQIGDWTAPPRERPKVDESYMDAVAARHGRVHGADARHELVNHGYDHPAPNALSHHKGFKRAGNAWTSPGGPERREYHPHSNPLEGLFHALMGWLLGTHRAGYKEAHHTVYSHNLWHTHDANLDRARALHPPGSRRPDETVAHGRVV
jgi:hypothetical protein